MFTQPYNILSFAFEDAPTPKSIVLKIQIIFKQMCLKKFPTFVFGKHQVTF